MIARLRRKIVLLVVLPMLAVLALILVLYNLSCASYYLNDAQNALLYCTERLEKYPELLEKDLDYALDKISEEENASNAKIKGIAYGILSSDLTVVKISKGGKETEIIGDVEVIEDVVGDPATLPRDSGILIGSLSGPTVMYNNAKLDDCTLVFILKVSDWIAEIRNVAVVSVLGFILAAIILTFIAGSISARIVRPVEEALLKQNRFIADASHELKTPISVINANIAVLENECGDNKWMRYIKEEGALMNELISQLLSLSRIDYQAESAQSERVSETFELSDVLFEAALPFDSIAFENNVSMNTEGIKSFKVSGSRGDLRQIISIIIDNAISHSGSGGEVFIHTELCEAGSFLGIRNKVAVSVRNTGSVIPEEELPHIFDRFYKGNSGTAGKSGNFGLGLSIAKALAERSGYELTAESGGGETTFKIVLDKA